MVEAEVRQEETNDGSDDGSDGGYDSGGVSDLVHRLYSVLVCPVPCCSPFYTVLLMQTLKLD